MLKRLRLANNIFYFLVIALGLSASLHAQTTTRLRRPLSPREIAQTSFPSVVLIVTEDVNGKPLVQGSGFFVGPDLIATNFHVINGATQIYVRIVGQEKLYNTTTVIEVDRNTDLALIRVSGLRARPLPLAVNRKIVAGDEAYALGNPQGFEGTISSGLVSGVRMDGDVRLLQFSASISRGSSGGPVLDDRGEVIGVVSLFFREGQNLNFAVHVSHLAELMNRAKNTLPANARAARPTRSSPPVGTGGNLSDKNPGIDSISSPPKAETVKTEPPVDPKTVYGELIPVLRRTIEAIITGDKAAFSELLADDFSETNGLRRWNKARYLAELAPLKDVLLHVIERAELGFDAVGHPVLTSVVRYKSINSQIARFENVFTYVKRDGRWQVLSWQSRSLSPYEGVPADPSLTSTRELLYEARMDLINKEYNSVIAIVKPILSNDPENAEANLLLGKGYFFAGKYRESIPYLVKAIALGQKWEVSVYHHRRTSLGLDDELVSGQLVLEKDGIQYRSEADMTVNGQRLSETNFSLPLAKIAELRYEADKGGRLRMEVMLPKGGKEECKTFNFYPAEARTRKQFSPEKLVVDCSECPPSMEAVYQILMRLMNK